MILRTNYIAFVNLKHGSMEEINYDKVRDPCEYCGKKHIDYACDAQLAFLEIAIKDDSKIGRASCRERV